MAYKLTGNIDFGAENETGLLVQSISVDYGFQTIAESKKGGETVGLVYSDEQAAFTLEAQMPKTSVFSTKIGNTFAISNTVNEFLNSSDSGSCLIETINTNRSFSDATTMTIGGRYLPYVSTT